MLFAYVCDDARRRVRITAREPFALMDLVAVIERQAADGAWGYSAILDLRVGSLSSDDQEALARHAAHLSRTHGSRGPVAIVARDPSSMQTYVLHGAVTAETAQVFRYAFQAEGWLDEQRARRRHSRPEPT
jgi:hypothetical protein